MSLIQAALEKTNCPPSPSRPKAMPQFMTGDPMGAHLEKELTRVQREYARHRVSYRKWGITGALLLCVAGVLFYLAGSALPSRYSPRSEPGEIPRPSRVVSQRVFFSVPLRLTGITNFGKKSLALINGQFVGVGDALSGNTVVKSIDDGSVLLDVRGKEIRLEL